MQHAMIKWNNVPTQVITEGRWVEEGLSQYGKRDVVVIIEGNPGVSEFYKGFIKTVKSRLPTETPVWVVGHAGHVQPPSNLAITMPSDTTWTENYSLMAQVQHKIDFIKQYVPEDAKLHLVGYSIGAWMVLNMLKDDSVAKKVTKCYLIFPTIEHMAASPKGQYFTKVISTLTVFIVFACWILSCLPLFLQVFLITIFRPIHKIPNKYNKALLQLLNPNSIKKVLKMAREEMKIVKERDDDIISKYADKLWFYYGNCDGWVPTRFYVDLKAKHPNINAELCKYGYPHDFVLQHDNQIGKLVGDKINDNIL